MIPHYRYTKHKEPNPNQCLFYHVPHEPVVFLLRLLTCFYITYIGETVKYINLSNNMYKHKQHLKVFFYITYIGETMKYINLSNNMYNYKQHLKRVDISQTPRKTYLKHPVSYLITNITEVRLLCIPTANTSVVYQTF
jgi:hypothetical protein